MHPSSICCKPGLPVISLHSHKGCGVRSLNHIHNVALYCRYLLNFHLSWDSNKAASWKRKSVSVNKKQKIIGLNQYLYLRNIYRGLTLTVVIKKLLWRRWPPLTRRRPQSRGDVFSTWDFQVEELWRSHFKICKSKGVQVKKRDYFLLFCLLPVSLTLDCFWSHLSRCGARSADRWAR